MKVVTKTFPQQVLCPACNEAIVLQDPAGLRSRLGSQLRKTPHDCSRFEEILSFVPHLFDQFDRQLSLKSTELNEFRRRFLALPDATVCSACAAISRLEQSQEQVVNRVVDALSICGDPRVSLVIRHLLKHWFSGKRPDLFVHAFETNGIKDLNTASDYCHILGFMDSASCAIQLAGVVNYWTCVGDKAGEEYRRNRSIGAAMAVRAAVCSREPKPLVAATRFLNGLLNTTLVSWFTNAERLPYLEEEDGELMARNYWRGLPPEELTSDDRNNFSLPSTPYMWDVERYAPGQVGIPG